LRCELERRTARAGLQPVQRFARPVVMWVKLQNKRIGARCLLWAVDLFENRGQPEGGLEVVRIKCQCPLQVGQGKSQPFLCKKCLSTQMPRLRHSRRMIGGCCEVFDRRRDLATLQRIASTPEQQIYRG